MLLETIDVETGAAADAAVIWLHGLGADAHDFEPVVGEIVRPGERAWRFVFPNAPIRPVTLNGGMRMRAWYDLKGLDRGAAEDPADFIATDAGLREIIDREMQRGVPSERIVLGGFSQGGAASLYTAPRLPQRLAGVMALSCYVPLRAQLQAERAAANDATPVFMAHGRADNMLPLALGSASRDLLLKLNYAVEWHEYPMGHAVCTAEIADIRAFLLRVLP
jgi:phospholipase/carboxylesterase